jgi:hypothetical protein
MRKLPKKTTAIIVGGVLAVAGAGGAYAYWTAGGTGSGTAAAGTNSGITVVQTSSIAGLAPGTAPQPLSGNFTNSNTSKVYVTAITASVGTVTKAPGAPAGTCDASDFTIAYTTGSSILVGADISPGSAQGSWSGATIAFNNKGTNQDACKLATVAVNYVSS